MPTASVRGAHINYEIHGTRGAWIALAPGGRLGLSHLRSVGQKLADAGYRVLLHDRRNCGASDVLLEGEEPEYRIWSDDLYALLSQLDALPAYIGGRSSGCRMSLVFALRHPEAVRALLLWRITGGPYACRQLAEKYYGEYIRAAQKGGMAAVCETEHFRERISERPSNRERLMSMDPQRFIAAMSRWNEGFLASPDQPVIGASAEEVKSIRIPACIIPGNDRIHSRAIGENLARLMPNSELHILFDKSYDVDMSPNEEWSAKDGELAQIFVKFMVTRALGTADERR